jgi:hypothetical protein
MFFRGLLGVLLLKLLFSSVNPAVAQFIDVSEMLGSPISVNYGSPNGNGLSFHDFNHDGWDDLTISRGSQMPLFFENQNGTFVPASFSIPTPTGKQFMMLLWVDLNNDGFEDLFISKFDGPIELWINDGNFNFTNIAPQSGIAIGNYNYNGSAIADYNKDGCLDLYIGKFYEGLFETGPHTLSRLYQSNCDGTYTDVTESTGVVVPTQLTFQPVFFDYNNDGWDDLYLINEMDYYQNQLFKNNGDGTFSDVSDESGAGVFIDAMSGTVGDFNNDNHLDVLVTNRPGTGGNYMMVNQGDNTFENQAEALGFGLGYQSWGSVWLDYDNDSWQDVFVSLPFPYQMPGNRFYVNQQGQGFTDERDALGFGSDNSDTYTCARGDINNDGYFDLAHSSWHTSSFKLYQNQVGVNNYLSVSLQGTHSNRNAIGSRIHCYAAGNHYTRYTHCGANLLGQDSRKEIFGLGNIEIVDSLVIEWSRGTREVYYDVVVNQHIHTIEGTTFSVPFEISFTEDLFLCEGDSLVLDAGEFESYHWNTGEDSRFLTVYNPGVYAVTVVNQFGFSVASIPLEVEAAPANETQIAVSDITCFGAMDGQLEVSFPNIPVTNLVWNTGDTTQLLTNLENGFYSFMGIDSYGCSFIGNAFISEPAQLAAEITTINTSCVGFEDGQVTTVISGGTQPYIVEIAGFLLNQLPAGNYKLQITDYNGCVLASEVEIVNPEELSLLVEVTHIFEAGNLGSANLSVFGGTGNYQIVWSTGLEDVYEISNLNAGEYWVLVADENDCFVQHDFVIENTTSVYQNLKSNIAVYPNPFDNCFWVSAAPGTSFSLYNNQGKLVLTFMAIESVTSFCLPELGAGLYTLVSISANDIQRTKLIKSN